jgi:hypothetical protein
VHYRIAKATLYNGHHSLGATLLENYRQQNPISSSSSSFSQKLFHRHNMCLFLSSGVRLETFQYESVATDLERLRSQAGEIWERSWIAFWEGSIKARQARMRKDKNALGEALQLLNYFVSQTEEKLEEHHRSKGVASRTLTVRALYVNISSLSSLPLFPLSPSLPLRF